MTWLATKVALWKVWAWIRNHAELVLGVVVTLVIVLLLSKGGQKVDLSGVFERFREKHKEEVDAIEAAHQAELKAIDEAEKRMESTLARVEEAHRKASKDLGAKKRKEIKRLIKKNEKDPDAITREIAELTGFTVVVRDDD